MPDSSLLRFVQLLPAVPASGEFLFKDLPGSGKRIDVLCRDLSASFDWAPHTLREPDVEFVALLENRVALTINHPGIILPKGEVAWAKVLKQALKGEPPEFIKIEEMDLEQLITAYSSGSNVHLWVLHEEGESFYNHEFGTPGSQNSFMLGDHKGFDSQTEEIIEQHGLTKVSLGSISYLSSHCVATIISEFERMFANVYR